MQISINLRPELLDKVDKSLGTQSRSAFITNCIYEHYQGGDTDKLQLIRDLSAHQETQHRLENEVEYLRGEYSKINDALAQRLLAEASEQTIKLTEQTIKKSFWQRLTGR